MSTPVDLVGLEHRLNAALLADDLRFPVSSVRDGLKRSVARGVVERVPLSRPARYRLTGSIGPRDRHGGVPAAVIPERLHTVTEPP